MRLILVVGCLLAAPMTSVAQVVPAPIQSPVTTEVAQAPADALAQDRPQLPPELSLHQFVNGFLRYTAFHELGHALTTIMALSVTGSAEDAVDDYAYSQTNWRDMVAAAEYWRLAHNESGPGRTPTIDRVVRLHGEPLRRAGRAICYLYDIEELDWRTQQRFGLSSVEGAFDNVDLEPCGRETRTSRNGWRDLISTTMNRERQWQKVEAKIDYRPSSDALIEAKAYLQATGVLEVIKDALSDVTAPPDNSVVHLIAMQCGTVNAFWMPSGDRAFGVPKRSLVLCYEDVADVMARGRALGLR